MTARTTLPRLLLASSLVATLAARAQTGEPAPDAPRAAEARPEKEPPKVVASVAPPASADPWTSHKVVLLGERTTYRLAVLPGDILGDAIRGLPAPVAALLVGLVGQPFPYALSNATAEVTTNGGQLVLGNWGFSFGVGDGALLAGDARGAVQRTPLSAMAGAISVSFGAWAPLDVGSFRLRVGVAWPELHLRFTRAVAQAPGGDVTWMALQLGGSALGLRVTLGELLFLEARLGEANVQVAYLSRGDSRALQRGYSYDLLPTFRAGLAF